MIALDQLRAIAPRADSVIAPALIDPLNKWLPYYAIDTGVPGNLRVPHFFGQAAEETDGFKTLHEYASGREYEGRRDLGNTHPGDGVRYKGRGIFDLTGRANYREYGGYIGVDLEANPELAAEPDNAVRLACEYWNRHGLSPLADADNILAITRRINGGTNGLNDRKLYYARAKHVFGVAPLSAAAPGVDVRAMQADLNKLDADIDVDGDAGPETHAAVSDFQRDHGLAVTGIADAGTAAAIHAAALAAHT